MEWIKKQIKIKDGVCFDGQLYSGMTGVTSYKADNGIWWIDLDKDSIFKMSYEYKNFCKKKGECFDVICLEEKDFEFIE